MVLDIFKLITPSSLNGVDLQTVFRLSAEERRGLKRQLVDICPDLIVALRDPAISMLNSVLCRYGLRFDFKPDRDHLPWRIQQYSVQQLHSVWTDRRADPHERLRAVVYYDVHSSTSAQKFVIYRYYETLLGLLERLGDCTALTLKVG